MRFFEFATPGSYWLALLPEIVLSVAAMVILMRGVFVTRVEKKSGDGYQRASFDFLVSMYAIGGAIIATLWLTDASGPVDSMIALDGFRVAANVILLIGAGLVVALGRDYVVREGIRSTEYHALLLMSLVGMLVLVAARDLILLFVGLELMSIPVYVLAGFTRSNRRASEASLKYFITGAFASAFVVYGIALLYGATGTTRLVVAASGGLAGDGFLLAGGIGLLLIGFGFKIAAVPFHMWAPDAYEGAPTPITSFMAAGVKAAAFVALLRVLTVDLAGAVDMWKPAVTVLAVLTMMVPNLIALNQRNVKRLLAWSSVAHAGYLLVGVAAVSEVGRAAALLYLAAYTVVTVGVFAAVWHLAGKGDQRPRLEDYRGLGWDRPVLGACLLVFLLSLAGFPPTAGFVGKLYLLRASVDAGDFTLAIVLVLSSLIAYYYYLRVVWKMYFKEASVEVSGPAKRRPEPGFNLVLGICAVVVLLVGLLPGFAIDQARQAQADEPAIVEQVSETGSGADEIAEQASVTP